MVHRREHRQLFLRGVRRPIRTRDTSSPDLKVEVHRRELSQGAVVFAGLRRAAVDSVAAAGVRRRGGGGVRAAGRAEAVQRRLARAEQARARVDGRAVLEQRGADREPVPLGRPVQRRVAVPAVVASENMPSGRASNLYESRREAIARVV